MKTRKIIAFALSLTICSLFASCSETKKSGGDSSDVEVENTKDAELELVSDFDTAFKLTDYDVPVSFDEIIVEKELTDTNELIVTIADNRDSDDYTYKFYRTDKALRTFSLKLS